MQQKIFLDILFIRNVEQRYLEYRGNFAGNFYTRFEQTPRFPSRVAARSMLINFAPLQSVSSAAILSGLASVASLCPAWPCVSLLACKYQVSEAISLRFASVAVAVARTVGGRAGLGRVRCTSRPSVRPSVSLSCLFPPFRICSPAHPALSTFFVYPSFFLLLVLDDYFPLSKSPLASRMDTRGRDVYVCVCIDVRHAVCVYMCRMHARVSPLPLPLLLSLLSTRKGDTTRSLGSATLEETTDSLSRM